MNSDEAMGRRSPLASVRESVDQFLGPPLQILSIHAMIEGSSFWKISSYRASNHWTQRVRHKSPSLCLLLSGWVSLIAFSSTICRFGCALKNVPTRRTTPIMFRIRVLSSPCTTAKFRQWDAQCKYKANGYLSVMRVAAPMFFPDMLPAPL